MKIIAHRGASRRAPENTKEAFKIAVENGVDVLETDVRLTGDGVVVLSHDETVERLTGSPGSIDSLRWDELRSLPVAGYGRYMSFSEALHSFPDTYFNVDLKDNSEDLARKTGAAIHEAGRTESVTVASFHPHILDFFRKNFPKIRTSFHPTEIKAILRSVWFGTSFPKRPVETPLQIPIRHGILPILSRKLVDRVHGEGHDVEVWTVNSRKDLERLYNLGVDAIMTDVPDLVQEWLTSFRERR